MRVLVVGSLPPPEGERAKALRSEVVRLLAEGHSVEVVAPNPAAAAHRYLLPVGLAGCLRLATMVGRYDAVVVQVEPGLPARPQAGRLEQAASLAAFSLALRHGRDVVLRLERVLDLPGGPGGRAALRVWRERVAHRGRQRGRTGGFGARRRRNRRSGRREPGCSRRPGT